MGFNLRILGALLLALPVTGCDQHVLQSPWKKNYADCLKDHRGEDALSADTIAAVCRSKYEKPVYLADDLTTGHAAPNDCYPEADFNSQENLALPRTCSSFSGTLENRTKFTVLTAIQITVVNTGTSKSTAKWVDGLWIEPGKVGDFHFAFDPAFDAKNWNAVNSGFTWSVSGTRGIRID
jgi:hypothetical protein